MHIANLTLNNFVCYRGENTLELGEKVYAVTARHAANPARSNWLGKSTFLRSIFFALTGEHPFTKEDQWITKNEDQGHVELTTSDGMTVKRSRIRGKSTQLIVMDGSKRLKGEEAQAYIIKRVGLTTQDFLNTSYFEQRKMAKFVLAKPDERQGIITAWFNLEPIQECEAAARDTMRHLTAECETYERELQSLMSYVTQLNESVGGIPIAQIDVDILSKTTESVLIEADIAKAERRLVEVGQALAQWDADTIATAEYHEIVAKGVALKADLAALNEKMAATEQPGQDEIDNAKEELKAAEADYKVVYAAWRTAVAEEAQKKALSKGEFDGVCPIAAMPCPAKDAINAPRKRNLELYDEAKAKQQACYAAYDAISLQVAEKQSALNAINERRVQWTKWVDSALVMSNQLESYRAEATKRMPALERARTALHRPDAQTLKDELKTLREALAESEKAISYLERAKELIQTNTLKMEQATSRLVSSKESFAIAKAAVAVFGRNGAQKRISERNLHLIEVGANKLLSTSGIDLNLAVQWAREGDGLANECDECGAVFPESKRVKECAKCGAARGPKLVNKLDLILSNKSGAAEDLAGIAFQLSASAWLRNERGSAWSTAMIDEPFSAMDEANRKAMSLHFATMLRGEYGYAQSFIVAHNRDVMESLPARIVIEADGEGSKLRAIG